MPAPRSLARNSTPPAPAPERASEDASPGINIAAALDRPLPLALLLLLLAIVTVAASGYHFAADDSGIYLPAVEQYVQPSLFPYGAAFFKAHGGLSVFPVLVGGTVRWLRLPLEWAVLGFHLLGVWLLLAGGLWLGRLCLRSQRARWGGVLTLACVVTLPVAGTAIPIMDPYLTARSLSTPLTLLSIAAMLAGRRLAAGLLLLSTALLHPQMAAFGAFVFLLLALPAALPQALQAESALAGAGAVLPHLPGLLHTGAAHGAYREALYARPFLFAWGWTWYEWLGALLPFGILCLLVRRRPAVLTGRASRLCRALLLVATLATGTFLFFSSSPRFDDFVRLQPMRCFHLLYIVMFLLLGGVAAELLLRDRLWRWVALFGPLALILFAIDRANYPASDHLELPGRAPANRWVQSFLWARQNTPQDAVFALPPRYDLAPGEDMHGFRAIARRSMLADAVKDAGVVSVFPRLAEAWGRDQALERNWERMRAPQFVALGRESPASWAVIATGQASGLPCPYDNGTVAVCRLR